jgi:hypothetical protein
VHARRAHHFWHEIPLPLLNTYGTMRGAPEPDLRRMLLAPASRVPSEFHLSLDREAFNQASARVL